ncbi:protein kinase family protein [Aspergillus lucknowensis]|uniref:Protein kinase domain-containing protein n=1 Tax=Aspergillus lucknowensis TaxID=176173 RepID=A0ABR4M7X3_9EURO
MAISIADSSCSSPRSSLGFLLDPDKVDPPRPKQSMWHRLGLRRWLGRDDRDFSSSRSPASSDGTSPASNGRSKRTDSPPSKSHDNITRRLSRKVGVGLPRSTTFKRQQSERRDRLSPVDPELRRAVSADRRTLSLQRTKSPQSVVDPRLSAPEVHWRENPDPDQTKVEELPQPNEDTTQTNDVRSEWDPNPGVTDTPEEYPPDLIDMELERRWILNLSMHFRDRSEREKFFVTYAEAPNRWRRVTISCDYRDAEPDSLEQDLKELRYQRDKCARVYESIRESLNDIQFYDTVTNLKLETRDGRLHVHVTEDVNEIIPYPPISSIGHLPDARLIPERRLHFEAHLSGFVYNVRLDGRSFIKKEIPGPDTVDEFLYEINALHALQGTPNVIQVEGIVVDDRQEIVKGLLISFAEKGALVDLLYEYRGTLPWERRERWARQIVHGLCEIHEAGYVQGDFTLSNIVVDANDDAKIIDINRRGCPVGWEPPEIADKIESNQRISMYIGVKTDLYQLGMTLWALAMEEDEPERQRRPFILDDDLPIPDYYRRMVSICLGPIPRHRLSAKELLNFFPREPGTIDHASRMQPHTSIGVGLHNGALPLYDARTAFLYPRGRQMGGFGHSNIQALSQLPHDGSLGSISSPETDGAVLDLEEQEHHRELTCTAPPRMNGRRKTDSGTFERRSVDDVTLVIGESPSEPETTQETRTNKSLPCTQNESDLEAGVDSRYRASLTDQVDEIPSSSDPLPNELAKIGSLNPVRSESPESSSTHANVALYPIGPKAGIPSSAEVSQPVLSLQRSALPINPAAESATQEIEKGADISTSNVAPEYSHNMHPQAYYLSESSLPINPAVKSSEEITDLQVEPLPPLDAQLALECTPGDVQDSNPSLMGSRSPMAPTARLSRAETSNIEPPKSKTHVTWNPTAETTLSYALQAAEDHNTKLTDSQLPVNSATAYLQKNAVSPGSDEVDQPGMPVNTAPPTLQDQNRSTFRGNSQLPINPATQLSDDLLNSGITPIDASSTVSSHNGVQGQNHSSFLRNSHLPINPAAKLPEKDICGPERAAHAVLDIQSTLQSQHNNQDTGYPLNDSHLPINPALTEKALQSI